MDNFMLTTIDNPFNPFEKWDEWYDYDTQNGYNTCSLLDRLSFTSEGLPDSINNDIIASAIDDIVKNDQLGIYIKIYKGELPIPININTI